MNYLIYIVQKAINYPARKKNFVQYSRKLDCSIKEFERPAITTVTPVHCIRFCVAATGTTAGL